MELSQLHVTQVTGPNSSHAKIHHLSSLSLTRHKKENLKKFYKGKEYRPLELCPKKTRGMNCWITKHEEKLKTKKAAVEGAALYNAPGFHQGLRWQ